MIVDIIKMQKMWKQIFKYKINESYHSIIFIVKAMEKLIRCTQLCTFVDIVYICFFGHLFNLSLSHIQEFDFQFFIASIVNNAFHLTNIAIDLIGNTAC